MIKKDYFLFFTVLQLIVAFGMVPLLLMKHFYGAEAMVVYSLTSVLILIGYGVLLWSKGRAGPRQAELGALGLGMVMAFLMAEVVAVTVMLIN